MRKTQEIQGNLARLLATENLLVEHKQVSTASFDVDKRVLTLPLWNRASDTVYTMLVGHEVGHALFTPNDFAFTDNCPKAYVNVTEDARIEKLMKRKFPGLTKDFYKGYQELNEDDFFCIANEDLSKMTLIDRVNLHYKIGAYALLPFDDAETPLRDAVGDAETFDEAVAAAIAIYEFSKEQQEKKQQTSVPAKPQGSDAPSTGEQETKQEPKPESGGEEGEGEQQEEEESRPWFTDSDPEEDHRADRDVDQADLDTPSYEYADPDINNVTTQRNFDNAAENLIDKEATSPEYVTFPKFDMSKIITPNKELWEKAEEYWSEYYADRIEEGMDIFGETDSNFTKFCNDTAKDVNYLVKEFECKKSASSYARSTTSRTGVLDTKKLHQYKFSEDIFKKVTRTPDGKNHGLVFLLDWSGSMSGEIFDTVKQIINLAQFCKKVGIPFDVYSFVTDASHNQFFGLPTDAEYRDIPDHQTRNVGEFWVDKRFKLVNLLTSEGNNKYFKHQCHMLFRVASYWQDRSYYAFRPNPPHFLGLGGTPLNDALVVMHQYLGEWQRKQGVEKSHLIILTDGESQCIGRTAGAEESPIFDHKYPRTLGYNTIIRNKGRYYNGIHNANTSATSGLIRILRDSYPECSILGFRICQPRALTYYLRVLDAWDHIDEYNKVFKRDKSVVVKNSPYTELYVIKSNSYDQDVHMEVTEDATKGQIRTAFKKTLKSKGVNRKMLSAFAGQIA